MYPIVTMNSIMPITVKELQALKDVREIQKSEDRVKFTVYRIYKSIVRRAETEESKVYIFDTPYSKDPFYTSTNVLAIVEGLKVLFPDSMVLPTNACNAIKVDWGWDHRLNL